jgi:sporulation protein YlmC with PRC-barrel domain
MSLSSPQAKGNYTLAVKQSIIGAKVVNAAKEDLGKIEDVVIDSRDSRVAYAILSFGGFLGVGHKHFAIPWQAIDFQAAEHHAILNVDKERLKNAPGFDNEDWPDMSDKAWEERVHAHYGRKPYWENSKSDS